MTSYRTASTWSGETTATHSSVSRQQLITVTRMAHRDRDTRRRPGTVVRVVPIRPSAVPDSRPHRGTRLHSRLRPSADKAWPGSCARQRVQPRRARPARRSMSGHPADIPAQCHSLDLPPHASPRLTPPREASANRPPIRAGGPPRQHRRHARNSSPGQGHNRVPEAAPVARIPRPLPL